MDLREKRKIDVSEERKFEGRQLKPMISVPNDDLGALDR